LDRSVPADDQVTSLSAIGGNTNHGPPAFATTQWSVVLAAQDRSPAADEALEKLCRTYWWPLYGFVRRNGYRPEEAQDLTQGFFALLLKRRDLDVVRRALREGRRAVELLPVEKDAPHGVGMVKCLAMIAAWIGDMGRTVPMGTPVFVNANGQLGTTPSSARFKPMNQASEAILCLKPVTFHYKSDHTARPQCGLIAEEVAEVNPDLVVRDKNGEIYTVRYDQVNAMLLNEFLKDHRRVEEQGRDVKEQKSTISQLKITAAKQEALIAQQQETFHSKLAEQGKQIEAMHRVFKT
jgi:hypothetical protein